MKPRRKWPSGRWIIKQNPSKSSRRLWADKCPLDVAIKLLVVLMMMSVGGEARCLRKEKWWIWSPKFLGLVVRGMEMTRKLKMFEDINREKETKGKIEQKALYKQAIAFFSIPIFCSPPLLSSLVTWNFSNGSYFFHLDRLFCVLFPAWNTFHYKALLVFLLIFTEVSKN